MMATPDRQVNSDPRPFIVFCCRQDGREREFMRYSTADEAHKICARLIDVGCSARVGHVDDLITTHGRAAAP
jgi:hypothetical protein